MGVVGSVHMGVWVWKWVWVSVWVYVCVYICVCTFVQCPHMHRQQYLPSTHPPHTLPTLSTQTTVADVNSTAIYSHIFNYYARWFRELDPGFTGTITLDAIDAFLRNPGRDPEVEKVDVFTHVKKRCGVIVCG